MGWYKEYLDDKAAIEAEKKQVAKMIIGLGVYVLALVIGMGCLLCLVFGLQLDSGAVIIPLIITFIISVILFYFVFPVILPNIVFRLIYNLGYIILILGAVTLIVLAQN